jgi:hypothetical protein
LILNILVFEKREINLIAYFYQKPFLRMEMSVKSKVDEISLRQHEFLLPLFEVIVNAMLSVGDKYSSGGGRITINIIREKKTGLFDNSLLLDKEGTVLTPPVQSFIITDNGVGFDDANYKSFNTAYSQKNKDKGCKGVGRFTVLACFDQMHIRSVYKNDNKQYLREFYFDVIEEVKQHDNSPQELLLPENNETRVTLHNYHSNFKYKTAIPAKQIAGDIIENCLPFFLSNNAPTILLHDDFDDSNIILNDIIKEVIKFDGNEEVFSLLKNTPPFKLLVIRRYDARIHRLRLCAHNRVVGRTENLAAIIPGFESPFTDSDGNDFCIDAYVTSSFLDAKVNPVRNSLYIPDNVDDNSLIDEITLTGIENEVKKLLEKKYRTTLDEIQDKNLDRIREYILNPKKLRVTYRSLLGKPELLKKLPTNLSDDKLEEQLHKIKFHLEKDLKSGLKKASRKGRIEDHEEYSKLIKSLLNQEAEFAKDKLADLLVERKVILKLLKKMLGISKDGGYNLEEDLHNLIFPMGQSNDTIPYEYHNLWILDERLAFHSFIASDKQMRTNPIAANNSQKEPDILIFDFPWAFSEKESPMSSVVIFEFKRPGRDMNTSDDKNLDAQVMRYYQELMQSKAKNYNGEYINLEKTTPKFAFIICDMHKDLMEYNVDFNQFRKTPFKTLYKLNEAINLHVEAMSYQQLVEMSEKRHLAFFRELGIETL